MKLDWTAYGAIRDAWPQAGRHIMASFDEQEIVVCQAYRPEIAAYAVEHQRFGGPFSLNRMSWIKPNFLWMMYRCGWATKADQAHVLAIHLRLPAFMEILGQAVWSSFQPTMHASMEAWQEQVRSSDVRLQWDPDHDPHGRPLERRAIQLGLRGWVLEQYAESWCTRIDDITDAVRQQHARIGDPAFLLVPAERSLPIRDTATRQRLGLDGDVMKGQA